MIQIISIGLHNSYSSNSNSKYKTRTRIKIENDEWSNFLTEGIYDPRLFLYISSFFIDYKAE